MSEIIQWCAGRAGIMRKTANGTVYINGIVADDGTEVCAGDVLILESSGPALAYVDTSGGSQRPGHHNSAAGVMP